MRQPANKVRKKGHFRYEWAAIILLIAIGLVYSYFKIQKALEFSTVKLFEKTFVEPVDSVKDLKGESKSIVGFESWIRFNAPNGVTLRDAKDFKPYIAEVGRSWFAEKYEKDKVLQESIGNYEYSVRTMNTVGNVINEGLLVNKNTHDYFYRTWGI